MDVSDNSYYTKYIHENKENKSNQMEHIKKQKQKQLVD
jgi:hypothetical protein